MTSTMKRVTGLGLAASVAAALAVTGALPASAAPNQYAPSIGTGVGSAITIASNLQHRIITSQACPAGSTVINGFVNSTAAGLTDAVAISTNSTDVNVVNTTGVNLDNGWTNIAASAGKVLVNGTYQLSVVCYPDAFSVPTAQFDVTFTVSGGVGTGAGTTVVYDVPAAPASTTVLTASPAGSANLGASVTLTAAVTSTAPVAGTVQFKSGATNVGSPVTVAGGSATLTTTALPAGAQSLTAQFIPTTPTVVAGSVSAPVAYTIVAPAQVTTISLSSGPAAPTTADVVTLTATLTPAGAAGTVNFKEGATTVGTAAVSGGTASISLTGLTATTHSYTADFVPTSAAAYLPSTASAISVVVTAFAGVSASENITTTVSAGTLTITAGGPNVDLGTPALNAANTLLVTAPKNINTVTVTDSRAGNLGYTVSGSVPDFVSGANKINSENLGWTPALVGTTNPAGVTAGPAVAAGSGVAVGATTGAGIKTPKTLALAAAGGSVGTAQLTAALVLQAPTTTLPGTYNTVLTLTAI